MLGSRDGHVVYDRGAISTGDILLFSGKGPISQGIKHAQSWFKHLNATIAKWSHVGVAVVDKELDLVLLWESTTLGSAKDIISGKTTKGVQLVSLTERLRTYDGEVGLRTLQDVAIDSRRITIMNNLRQSFRGRPYEQNKIELIRSVYDGAFGDNKRDVSSLFCSELVAELYIAWGLLLRTPPSNEYTPADFAVLSTVEGQLSEVKPLMYGGIK